MSQNREACAIHGINVRHISILTFAISSGLTGLAAALISPLFNVLPTMGTLLTLKAFAAVIMGGFGRVSGAIYASFLIGFAEAFAAGYGHLSQHRVSLPGCVSFRVDDPRTPFSASRSLWKKGRHMKTLKILFSFAILVFFIAIFPLLVTTPYFIHIFILVGMYILLGSQLST